MLAEQKRNTNIGVGVGIVLQVFGRYLQMQGSGMSALGSLMLLMGIGVFLWGCWNYAQGKGYHGAWGLLGLFSLLGLIILAVLPDRHKTA
ncbi:MAG: hypothetical protein P8Y64_13340 [Gammaproteobacteria bacterium]|jgi:hypothetical protein